MCNYLSENIKSYLSKRTDWVSIFSQKSKLYCNGQCFTPQQIRYALGNKAKKTNAELIKGIIQFAIALQDQEMELIEKKEEFERRSKNLKSN